jgi:hypothetical protein
MKFLFQICFTSQNCLCPICKLKNKLQLKYKKVIIPTIKSDFEWAVKYESFMTKWGFTLNRLHGWYIKCIYEPPW